MIAMKFRVLDMWWIILQRGHFLKNPVCTNKLLVTSEDVHPFQSLWFVVIYLVLFVPTSQRFCAVGVFC